MRQTLWRSILSFCVLALKTQRSSEVPMYRGAGSSSHGDAAAFGHGIEQPAGPTEYSNEDLERYAHFHSTRSEERLLNWNDKSQINEEQTRLFRTLKTGVASTEPGKTSRIFRIKIGLDPINKEMKEVETKLSNLFDELKSIQLHIFGLAQHRLDSELVKRGQIDMIRWVVNQLLKPSKDNLVIPSEAEVPVEEKDPEFDSQELVKLQKEIANYLIHPGYNEVVEVVIRKNSGKMYLPKDRAIACKVAFSVLGSYYKTTNKIKWQNSFKSFSEFSSKILKSQTFSHQKKETKARETARALVEDISLVPWA